VSHASQRYSPELQKKALARREETQQGFDDFTRQLRELSKSDKPSKVPDISTGHLHLFPILTTIVWIAQKEMDSKRSAEEQQIRRDERDAYAAESRRRQAEIRSSTQ
jgi:hypothetical protein